MRATAVNHQPRDGFLLREGPRIDEMLASCRG